MSHQTKVASVLFDIGGTIIQDNGEVITAFTAVLGANGVAVSATELSEFKGASKRDVIRFLVERQWGKGSVGNDERIEKAYVDFRIELEAQLARAPAQPIQGTEPTFAWLKAHNIICATTSGFYRSIRDGILSSTGWQNTFAANICSDDVPIGRPYPCMIFHAMEASEIHDVQEVLIVGDTPLDIQAGKRAGVLGVIGVLTGMHTKDRLQQESPSHLISSVADLPRLIEAHYS